MSDSSTDIARIVSHRRRLVQGSTQSETVGENHLLFDKIKVLNVHNNIYCQCTYILQEQYNILIEYNNVINMTSMSLS